MKAKAIRKAVRRDAKKGRYEPRPGAVKGTAFSARLARGFAMLGRQ